MLSPTPAMPLMATGATVLGLYSHIADLVYKKEGEILPPFKGAKLKQTRGRGKPKGKPHEQRQNPPKAQVADETYIYDSPNIITMITILPQVRVMAVDLSMVKVVTDNLEVSLNKTEAKDLNIININFRIINFREVHFNRTILNMALAANSIFREIKQMGTEAEAVSNLEDAVVVGPIIRVAMEHISINTTCMTHRQNSRAHLVVYVVVLIIPRSTATKKNMI